MAGYRVDISVTGEGAWVADSPVFDTIAEAEEYATGLAGRGTVVRWWRVVPTDTPTGEQVDDTERRSPSGRITWETWKPEMKPLLSSVGSITFGPMFKKPPMDPPAQPEVAPPSPPSD